jgi:hypothetical protein
MSDENEIGRERRAAGANIIEEAQRATGATPPLDPAKVWDPKRFKSREAFARALGYPVEPLVRLPGASFLLRPSTVRAVFVDEDGRTMIDRGHSRFVECDDRSVEEVAAMLGIPVVEPQHTPSAADAALMQIDERLSVLDDGREYEAGEIRGILLSLRRTLARPVPTAEDLKGPPERCKAVSSTSGDRCQLAKGHEGDHQHAYLLEHNDERVRGVGAPAWREGDDGWAFERPLRPVRYAPGERQAWAHVGDDGFGGKAVQLTTSMPDVEQAKALGDVLLGAVAAFGAEQAAADSERKRIAEWVRGSTMPCERSGRPR